MSHAEDMWRAVNARRVAAGKEPVTLIWVTRAMRLVGFMPKLQYPFSPGRYRPHRITTRWDRPAPTVGARVYRKY